MKEKTQRFSRSEPLEKSMDFNYLKNKALEYVQELSGGIWTDYNAHDPGVTILEQLCFALTDLSYRSAYDVEELLTISQGKPIDAQNHAFYSPKMIFSKHPVTHNDFRKILIDEFHQIQNVWIYPCNQYEKEEGLTGLNNLEILPSLNFQRNLGKEPGLEKDFLKKVQFFLSKNRNLGEDFHDIVLLKPNPFQIDASISIFEEENPDLIFASLLFGLEVFLYHPVAFSSFEELKEEGLGLEEIFTGPRLQSGFIKDSALKNRNDRFYLEQAQKIFSAVAGVKKIWNIAFNSDPLLKFLKTEKGTYSNLLFDDSEKGVFHTIKIFSNGNRLRIDPDTVNNLLLELWSKNFRNYPMDQYQEEYFDKKLVGIYRNPKKYTSIQKQFPLIYGIGKEGVSKHESMERKALVKQLKAYLLFFEQHLANHLAQLANLNRLFSIDYNSSDITYYYQQLEGVAGIDELEVYGDSTYESQNQPFDPSLSPYTSETENEFLDRKNRLFDHLLSRFGERLDMAPFLSAMKLNLIPSERGLKKLLLKRKSAFLIGLENINYFQTKGEYFGEGENNFNDLSGLEQILLIKTGISRKNESLISEMIEAWDKELEDSSQYEARPMKISRTEFKEKYRHLTEEEKTRKVFLNRETEFPLPIFGPVGIKSLMKNSLDYSCFKISKAAYLDGEVDLIFQKTNNSWVGIMERASESEAVDKVNQLIAYFREVNLASEGFYLVDHVLLREILEESSYGFFLTDHFGEKTFQSKWVNNEKARKRLLKAFYKSCMNPDSYQLKENSVIIKSKSGEVLGTYNFESKNKPSFDELEEIIDKNRDLAILMSGSEEEKGRLGLREIELIRLKGTLYFGKKYQQRRVVMNRKLADDSLVSEDFFDQKISICLPNWPARFQEPHFRDYFENLVQERTPAHLQVRVHWLGYLEMVAFENSYLNWRRSLKESQKENWEEFYEFSLVLHRLILEMEGGVGNEQ